MTIKSEWILQPQEKEGTYRFSGTFLVTKGVNMELSKNEIMSLYYQVQRLVRENGGIDYLVVFKNKKGEKLFFIDQLNDEMIASGGYDEKQNHCTLMFAHEY